MKRRIKLPGCLALVVGTVFTGVQAKTVPAPAASAPPRGWVQLPLQTAWFEGRRVHYVTTDVSDAQVARDKGANHVPRLKELLPGPGQRGRLGVALERVYAFEGAVQSTVFPSVPQPVGAGSTDAGYSPLWRMVLVRWKPGVARRELRSEEQVLAAEEAGELTLTVTDVVLNCPVVGLEKEAALPGVRLMPPPGR